MKSIAKVSVVRSLRPDPYAEIERLRQQLREQQVAKDQQARLLASVLHDIRSPLNVILVASQIMADPNVRMERRERNGRLLREAATSINTLCQDVLDYSKLSAGQMELSEQAFNVRDCIFNTTEGLRLIAEKKGIQLRTFVSPDTPSHLVGDPGRLRQVLANLLTNAIKYTHQGSVDVSVNYRGRVSQEQAALHIEVRDTGMGIHSHKLQEIFNPFEMAHGSLSSDLGGTGLGLAIAKHLVECMGGTLAVSSHPGRGTTFEFTARMGLTEEQGEKPELTLQARRVLILDESPESQTEMESACLALGLHPVLARDGIEGVRLLEEACEKNCPFPLAIVNMECGGGDGLFLVEQIRPDRREQTHFLAYAPQGQRGDALRCQEVGVQAFLTGAVDRPVLEAMLLAILQNPAPQELVTRHSLRKEEEPV
ncbi:ATP-binding protein [bacterium]|nr:ATP-binding protein [bacterium]